MSQGIPESVIDAIRQQTDLVSLVGEYLTLEKRGKDLVGLCPFHHEKTPSFTVSPDKQLFYCFGCGASGNVFSFIMKLENLTFPEAARLLAARAGIRIPERSKAPAGQDSLKEKLYAMNLLAARYYHHQLINTAGGKKALEYLRERGIGRAASEIFMLGYAPEGWDNLKSFFVKKGYSEQLLIGQAWLRHGKRQRLLRSISEPLDLSDYEHRRESSRAWRFGLLKRGYGRPKIS